MDPQRALQKDEVIEECKRTDEILADLDVEYLFIKTLNKPEPRDIDLLIEDPDEFDRAIREFDDRGYETRVSDAYHRASCVHPRFTDVEELDVHSKVSWGGLVFLEDLDPAAYVDLDGTALPVPDMLDDFLIHCAHILYGKRTLDDHDTTHFFDLLPEVDLAQARRRAAAYGWDWSLDRLHAYLTGRSHYDRWRLYKVAWIFPIGLAKKTGLTSPRSLGTGARAITRYGRWKVDKAT